MSGEDFKIPEVLILMKDGFQLKRWLRFKQQIEEFFTAPGLKGLSEASKSDIFINCVGAEAKELYFNVLKTEETIKYKDLIQCFDDYFETENDEFSLFETPLDGTRPISRPRNSRKTIGDILSPDWSCKNLESSNDDDEEYMMNRIAECMKGMKSDDVEIRTLSTETARRMLSDISKPPIALLVNAGIIAPLVDALTSDCSKLQFEAAWVLTNIASGTQDQADAVVAGGAIPHLVALVSRGGNVGEQAAWALGNIAAHGSVNRDAVLMSGALTAMLPFMLPETPNSQLKTNVCTYMNMCRNKGTMVKLKLVSPALPYIAELLLIQDEDVLSNSCSALFDLTDGPNERIESVQTVPSLTARLIALLGHNLLKIKKQALRAVGNMLTGTETRMDRCLDAGLLDRIIVLLSSNEVALVKNAALAASKILAGSRTQIKRALDSDILQPLINMLEHEDGECQKQAAQAITNLCLGATAEQLNMFLSASSLQPYCIMLSFYAQLLVPDPHRVLLALDTLFEQLKTAAKYAQMEDFSLKLEKIGILDRIQTLQKHNDEQVKNQSTKIMDTYFCKTAKLNDLPASCFCPDFRFIDYAGFIAEKQESRNRYKI